MDATDVLRGLPAGLSWRDRLATRLVLGRLGRWREGRLRFELPDGNVVGLGEGGTDGPLDVVVHDWSFFRRILSGGDIGVGDAYMDGTWTTPDLPGLCAAYLRNGVDLEGGVASTIENALLALLRRNSLRGSARNIRAHYDLGNDFYELFLDRSMTYSCALFETPESTLEEAQEAKIRRVCERLALRPGLELLEIGGGWGSLAIHAAREHGVRVTAITLSEEQQRLGRERVREAGLADRIDIRLEDYRSVRGRFDRIVSVEMLEAVGYEYFPVFFRRCAELLRPGGRLVLQTISFPDQRFDRYRKSFDWVRKRIFPGGLVPSLFEIARAAKEQTSLRIVELVDIGPHYARTLHEWRRRFLARLPEARRLGFDDRFVRMWDFYFASCEAAFATGFLGDLQILLQDPAAREGSVA